VPSLPTVILAHHVVTFVLLCVPLRHPHLHWYTCVDGLVELNTFFLIARRQWHSRAARKLFRCGWLPGCLCQCWMPGWHRLLLVRAVCFACCLLGRSAGL
jgi:hypothetical protein